MIAHKTAGKTLSWNRDHRLFIQTLVGLACLAFYFNWWFEADRWHDPLLVTLLIPAVIFSLTQLMFAWYLYLHMSWPPAVEPLSGCRVDVFIPVYNEPLALIEQTLTAACAITYPHTTYLLDDGRQEAHQKLAHRLGAVYLSRADNTDHKAGNINHALSHSQGDFIVVFDADHIPAPDFLDRVMGPFRDEAVGFVQVALHHYNRASSFIAAANAQRNDGFFRAPMLGLAGIGGVQAFGSNCVLRRAALDDIGGYKPGLAEDLNTSMHLHAAGWRSVYVPEILAEGLEPEDLRGFMIQQLKWSAGVFHLLFRVFPRLIRRLDGRVAIGYIWRLTCYLAGPAVALHILATAWLLFFGTPGAVNAFSDYVCHWLPLVVVYIVTGAVADRKYQVAPPSPGVPFGGLALALGSWPIYTLAFFGALVGYKFQFRPTPKQLTDRSAWKLILPQFLTVFLLVSGIVFRLFQTMDMDTAILLAFALGMIGMHAGVFYAWLEAYRTPAPHPSPFTSPEA